jgi:hypothetical protein
MIVLVVKIEQHVSEGAKRVGDRLHRFRPCRLRREQREGLPGQLAGAQDDEFERQAAVRQPSRQREQARAAIGTERAVGLINRGMPVRPHAYGVDTPAGERIEIAVARRNRAERVEQAYAGEERFAPVEENLLLRNAERARRRRAGERDRKQCGGAADQGCAVLRRSGASSRGSLSICPGTR